MSAAAQSRAAFDAAIDSIESGYEFLLAYAAQGRRSDRDGPSGREPRARLTAMNEALEALPELVQAFAQSERAECLSQCSAYFEAFGRDAAVAAAAVRLVLAQTDISSQLVDNLNASIHLRAVLTDIFLIDEAFKRGAET
jgi:hypothetical protein